MRGHDELDGAMAKEAVVRLANRARLVDAVQTTAVHDFRDSLNSMTINIELLSRAVESDPAGGQAALNQRCITALRQELKRLATLMANTVNEDEGDPEPPGRVNLTSVVEWVKAVLRGAAQRQRVSMRFSPPAQPVTVVGQVDELRQAVFNAATNAIEAMTAGGQLAFDVSADGDTAVLTVTDTGPGIPSEARSQMWDLLFSTKTNGLGLGLPVVKRIAASHGGVATLSPGESGVTFTLRLPVAP